MRKRSLLALLFVGGLLLLPGTASAGTVSVTTSTGAVNEETIRFEAAPGEANLLKISVVSEDGLGSYTVQVEDAAGGISSPQCGAVGVEQLAVQCRVRKPVGAALGTCLKGGCMPVPGTEWKLKVVVVLGDGGSRLNAGFIPNPPPPTPDHRPAQPISFVVTPGAGDDVVLTSGGEDTVASSLGADNIQTAGGDDTLLGGPVPDGADEVDLGPDRDVADFRARTAAVVFKQNDLADDGGVGEGDRLRGVETLHGGSGDDVLEGAGTPAVNAHDESLLGWAGDDRISGGVGEDYLFGGPGDDTVSGGDGDDQIYETEDGPEAALSGDDTLLGGDGEDQIDPGAGDDRADGGDGGDLIRLGPGADVGDGAAGRDEVRGESGDDLVIGSDGNDRLAGDAGRDDLLGGEGADSLLSGSLPEVLWEQQLIFSGGRIENAPDRVDCGGGGGDRAGIDRTDGVVECEFTVRLRRLEVLPRAYPTNRATELRCMARVPGVISISGSGVKPYRLHDGAEGYELGLRFRVRPVGWAERRLDRFGHVRVRVNVALGPDAGGKIVRTRWVRIAD